MARRAGGIVGRLLERRYRVPHSLFGVETRDGVPVRGLVLDGPSPDLLVYGHGFLGSSRLRIVPAFLESLSRHFRVAALDFRGHGQSGGACTMGDREVYDLEAVVGHLRSIGPCRRLVLVGASMGASAVFRYAALSKSDAALVGLAPLVDLDRQLLPATRLTLAFFFDTQAGRRLARLLYGVELGALGPHPSPLDLAGDLPPTPLLLVTSRVEPLLDLGAVRRFYAAAPGPKAMVRTDGWHAFLSGPQASRAVLEWMRSLPGASA